MTTEQPPAAGTPFPSVGSTGPQAEVPPPAQRPRWLLPVAAMAGVAGILALSGLVVFSGLLSGAPAATRSGYEYVPASVIAAVEVRLDMPSGQEQHLVSFLTRLPDFAGQGQAQVEQQLDELLDEAVQTATAGRGTYQADVEPWFAGWIVVAGTAEPAALPPAPTPVGDLWAVLGSNDRSSAAAALLKLRPAGDWASEDVSGVTVWSRTPTFDGEPSAYAVTDDAVLLSRTVDDIKLALDTRANTAPSLLEVPEFADQWNALPAGRLAAAWIDTAALAEIGSQLPIGAPIETCDALPQASSATAVLYMRDGRAVVEISSKSSAGASPAPNRDSDLDNQLPADTFFYASGHGLGTTVGQALECLRDNPQLAASLADIERQIGPLDEMTAWIGDTAVAARYDGSRATLGLVVRVTDQTRAAEAMGQLRTALIGFGQNVTVAEEDYQGTRLVTITFGDNLEPPAPNAALSYAFEGDLLIVGIDGSFTRAVLDTTDATSLRSNATYRRAMEFAGGYSNSGAMYLDVSTAADLAAAIVPLAGIPSDIGAYLEAFDSVVVLVSVNGQTATTRMVLSTSPE